MVSLSPGGACCVPSWPLGDQVPLAGGLLPLRLALSILGRGPLAERQRSSQWSLLCCRCPQRASGQRGWLLIRKLNTWQALGDAPRIHTAGRGLMEVEVNTEMIVNRKQPSPAWRH